jgi:hypothetical protein
MDSGRPDAPCVPGESGELCNGLDDDCDEAVDEGHDLDGDNFTWCGGGFANQADCDDNDPSSHPGNSLVEAATERCDGADNDCDGMIDEDDGSGQLCPAPMSCIDRICADPNDCSLASVNCPAGQRCDFARTPPACVPGGCTPGSCTGSGEICNVESGLCVLPAAIGESCDTDADCAGTAICIPGAALGLGGGRICTEACCTDTECSGGNVCWVSGSGVKLCVPPSRVGTSRGPGTAGTACSSGGACASGVCLDSRCLANCGTDGDCGSLSCVATVTSMSSVQFACDTPDGPIGQGMADLSDEGCSSRFSSGYACSFVTLSCGPICIGSCRTTADCPSSIADTVYYCGFVGADGYDSTFAACTEKRHDGTAVSGGTCTNNSGCRDATCLMGMCADSCCTTDDCSGTRTCRPIQIRGQWETHCI